MTRGVRIAGFSAALLLLVWTVPGFAASSSQLWVARYDGPGDFLDAAQDMVVSPEGGTVYVTGLSDAASGSAKYPVNWADYATIAYETATGSERWVARYNGPGDRWDSGNAIALSPDGTRVYVTGASKGLATGWDFATVAYDATTGSQLWVSRYDGPTHLSDEAISVFATTGEVIVAGRSLAGFTTRGNYLETFAIVAYDASTGQQRWTSLVNECGHSAVALAAAMSPDGSTVFVTGWEGGCGSVQARTVAVDVATGALIWSRRSSHVVAAYAIAVGGELVFVTGTGHDGYDTVAYDATTGQTRWRAALDPKPTYGEAWGVVVSPDDSRLVVTGEAIWRSPDGCYYWYDYTTAAYDAGNGDQLWLARYDGPGRGFDWARGVDMSSDGAEIYVTGESAGFGGVFSCTSGEPRTGQDYATIAYDADTGAQLWVERYDSPDPGLYDSAHGLVVGPTGDVFVTGESHGGGYRDYATIAYSAS